MAQAPEALSERRTPGDGLPEAAASDSPLAEGQLERVISLGAGVQSSVMLLRAAEGEWGPPPCAAIFADTGWEPPGVYEHLDWLEEQVAGVIPIHRVSAGDLRADLVKALETGERWVGVPLHIVGEKGHGQMRRQCTREYKLDPIARQLRELGFGPKKHVEQWVGISLDEVQRMKPSRLSWQHSRWPLVEARQTRHDLLLWFQERYPGRKLTKSACVGCPYHNTAGWRGIKQDPELWKDAVEMDELVRGPIQSLDAETEGFLHYSGKPLSEIDLSTPEERGQLTLAQEEPLLDPERFDEECEGMCGV